MNKYAFCFSVFLLFALLTIAINNPKDINKFANQQGLGFTENKGQMVDDQGNFLPDVLLKISDNGMNVYITILK